MTARHEAERPDGRYRLTGGVAPRESGARIAARARRGSPNEDDALRRQGLLRRRSAPTEHQRGKRDELVSQRRVIHRDYRIVPTAPHRMRIFKGSSQGRHVARFQAPANADGPVADREAKRVHASPTLLYLSTRTSSRRTTDVRQFDVFPSISRTLSHQGVHRMYRRRRCA